MVKNFIKKKILNDYLNKLPTLLQKDYGFSQSYTPMQVIKTIDRYKLNDKYVNEAVAMFCSRDDHKLYAYERGFDADTGLSELGILMFNGNTNYDSAELLRLTNFQSDSSSAWSGGDADCGDVGDCGDGGGSD
jgi:hypothetical protein